MTEPTPLPIAIRVFPEPHSEELSASAKGSRIGVVRTRCSFSTPKLVPMKRRPLVSVRTASSRRAAASKKVFFVPTISRPPIAPCSKPTSNRTRREPIGATVTPRLLLLSRREFLARFYLAAYKARSLVVGFNLPFDLSRLACRVGKARGRYAGGFSLALWDYQDEDGTWHIYKHRPRIAIKHIDSKRALMAFTKTLEPDRRGSDSTMVRPRASRMKSMSSKATSSICAVWRIRADRSRPYAEFRLQGLRR